MKRSYVLKEIGKICGDDLSEEIFNHLEFLGVLRPIDKIKNPKVHYEKITEYADEAAKAEIYNYEFIYEDEPFYIDGWEPEE